MQVFVITPIEGKETIVQARFIKDRPDIRQVKVELEGGVFCLVDAGRVFNDKASAEAVLNPKPPKKEKEEK